METQNQVQEIKEQQNGKFAIDLLPTENRIDKFSYMTNLSILSWVDRDSLQNLWILNSSSSGYAYITGHRDSDMQFFAAERKKYWYKDTWWITSWQDIANCWCLTFKVKSISIKWEYIIIESTDDHKYTWKIEEYLSKWVWSLIRKSDWEVANISAKIKQTQKLSLEWWLLNIKSKQLLSIWADDYCITDESISELCILKDNKIATYTYDEDSIDRQSDYFDLSAYGTIKNIRTDINNNFYFIVCEKEGQSELKVLNRKTLEDIMSFKDLNEIVYLSNETGKLFCMDKDGYLRIVTINTKSLPREYVDNNEISAETAEANIIKIEDKPRSDLKNILKAWRLKLSHSAEEELWWDGDSMDDKDLREQLWLTKIDGFDDKTLRDLYTEATTPKDIDIVNSVAQQFKKNGNIMAIKGLVDPIFSTISTKRDQIKLKDIGERLVEITEDIKNAEDDFTAILSIKTKLNDLKQSRSQILSVNKETDTLLRESLQLIDQKIQEYQNNHKENIFDEISENCKHISEYMEGIDYLPQITSIYSTDLWKNTEQMLSYLSEEDRKLQRKKMSEIVQARQMKLNTQSRNANQESQKKEEETITNIRTNLTSLKGILDSINDEDTLTTMETSDPLMFNIKQEIETLSASKAQELNQKLEQIFKERLLSIQFSKESGGTSMKTLDQYGIPKSLYFVPDIIQKVKRDISAKQTKDWLYKLQFVSSAGNVIEPSMNKKFLGKFKFTYTFDERRDLKEIIAKWNSNENRKKYTDLSDKLKELEWQKESQEYKEALKSWIEMAKRFYIWRMIETMDKISGEGKLWNVSTRNNLPHLDNRTVITESIEHRLSKRGRILSQQQQYKQGIMIVESEAGTGKNFKCDILGHLTNREIFDISCNEYMEKEDLLFSPEIDNDGTHRKPSNLIKGLQTPGSIIVLDEINTLKPWVSKLLNPLLDGRRYINDPQMGRIYVHPSVLIVGLMNPRYYRGTKELPQEVVSRARMTNDKYAPDQEEAFQISKYLEWPIAKLSRDQFKEMWNEYIVLGHQPNDKKVYNVFVDLKKVVTVAKNIREVYSKTKRWDANIGEELDYVFTIRDGNYTIQDYNYSKDIKESLKDIILMKISDPEQKDFANQLIEESCK